MKYIAIFDLPDGYKMGCAVGKMINPEGKEVYNEEEVLIIVEHRPFMRPVHRRVVRAFYEDGLMRAEDSVHVWEYMPEGWFRGVV